LLDGDAIHYVLGHSTVVIAVYLGTTEEDKTKLEPFLETDHVLGTSRVRPPDVLVEVLPVPPAILCCEMIDNVKGSAMEDSIQLATLSDVAPNIGVAIRILEVCGEDIMPS